MVAFTLLAAVGKHLLPEARQACRDNLTIDETYGRGGGVGRGLGVSAGLGVGEGLGVEVCVAVAVAVAVGVAVGVDVREALAIGVGVGVTVAVAVTVAVGVGLGGLPSKKPRIENLVGPHLVGHAGVLAVPTAAACAIAVGRVSPDSARI